MPSSRGGMVPPWEHRLVAGLTGAKHMSTRDGFARDGQAPISEATAGCSLPLTPEQARRWATLIAEARDEFPSDLPPVERERLATDVRRLRRQRLVALIARAIAQDISRH